MDKIVICGGSRLRGDVQVAGSKNAALPILIATLLTDDPVTITNIPHLVDIETTYKLLASMGAHVEAKKHRAVVKVKALKSIEAPYELVKTMRASFLVIGPLLARLGKARVSLPGGCAIGTRPVDIHIRGLQRLGAKIKINKGFVDAHCQVLRGCKIPLDFPSVGATENLMMASALAKGKTTITNAACEPEIEDLALFLNALGAKIEGAGTPTVIIQGVKKLAGGEYRVCGDRIEAGTLMVAAAMTRGKVLVKGFKPTWQASLLEKLQAMGIKIKVTPNSVEVSARGGAKVPVNIATGPYPGFPTDMQAQMMALATVTPGTSIIRETVFENRFMHVAELQRLGADIMVEGNTVMVNGVKKLTGAKVMATDLRASAALVLAGLVADGETEVQRIYHLDRGYEKLEEKLAALGADISRELYK